MPAHALLEKAPCLQSDLPCRREPRKRNNARPLQVCCLNGQIVVCQENYPLSKWYAPENSILPVGNFQSLQLPFANTPPTFSTAHDKLGLCCQCLCLPKIILIPLIFLLFPNQATSHLCPKN